MASPDCWRWRMRPAAPAVASGPAAPIACDPPTANLWPFLNSVQIVEGTPVKLEHLRDRTFLNFGMDYATDFTLTISARDRKLFDPLPWRLEDLIGRRLRIRGWLELRGGPLIEITYPEQIEVLE